MIRESRRAEFAKAALAGQVFGSNVNDSSLVARQCYIIVDAMLAELDKETGSNNNE
jgi:hypothetical protein